MIIVAFDFRTKCAVTDRIETACIVDDLQLLLFKPNVTCMQGLEIHLKPGNTVRGEGTVFPKGIRSAGPKIGPDRIPYDTGNRTFQSYNFVTYTAANT